ncbi:unnamed protein product (mitochondrion) [Plasmodiophora brassicae]|uniref:Acyl-CoA oxidase/dehydrogenase middle domain-containing protein n=1 Tax=Plasmodiophora brassicae TaxID=37360 RepID=A0A3P3Y4Y0_PLABS|nr:unnamed protein product [Plasmodiophora brassicae]
MAITDDDEAWRKAFTAAVADVGDRMSYQQAAERLRSIVCTGLLTQTDIVERPHRFYEAHRLTARESMRLGPGLVNRFTVHYNLFAGTVIALGTREQIAQMTAAEFDRATGQFIINTPNPRAARNWISQGLVADEGVVIATLTVKGKTYGPQVFLVTFRDDAGSLLPGIQTIDMGRKTVGNDLDNARLIFTKPDAGVVQPNGQYRAMEMTGQRLFTGRIAVAYSTLEFAKSMKSMFANAHSFVDRKPCWAPGGRRPNLNQVPQIRAIFHDADRQLAQLTSFMRQIENRLADRLRNDRISAVDLQQAIAVAKVKVVETSISLCFALKQDVGSYALMAGKGFENLGTKDRQCVIEADPGCQTSCNAASSSKATVAF